MKRFSPLHPHLRQHIPGQHRAIAGRNDRHYQTFHCGIKPLFRQRVSLDRKLLRRIARKLRLTLHQIRLQHRKMRSE